MRSKFRHLVRHHEELEKKIPNVNYDSIWLTLEWPSRRRSCMGTQCPFRGGIPIYQCRHSRSPGRPGSGSEQLWDHLRRFAQGDEVFVHSMDRLARNLADLLHLVTDLTGKGVEVTFQKESLTFTGEDSPMATMMLSIIGAVAAFERSMILERQREGIAIAKARGA